MCDIDEMYSDCKMDEINDELLISLVMKNPLLYDKSKKDFKNTAMKKDTWTAIGLGCGASSGEAAEQRWSVLRNMLGRKMREMKAKQPSGSGGGKKHTPWPLLPLMTFILPYMDNRKKRGSSLTPSEPNSTHFQSPSPVPSQTEEEASASSLWDSTVQIFSPPISEKDLSEDSTEDERLIVSASPSPTPQKRRKAAETKVPPSDAFANKKRKKSLDTIEVVMQQSANAMQVVAEALSAPEEVKVENTPTEHPFMTAVKKAFQGVPPEKEMDCFMKILSVIKEFTDA